jgi:putative ABC transport system permease protein
MVSIAKENLFHEKIKTVMSIGGVILSVFLIFTINGVYNGMNYTMESIVYNTGADLWITQEGTSGSLHSPSNVNFTDVDTNLKTIEGIEEYTPFIRSATVFNYSSTKNVLLVINGYNTSGTLGGPWNIVKGASTVKKNEIIIDRVFALQYGFSIDDNITISSKEFTIVGLTDETNIMMGFIVFLKYEDAANFLLPGITNSFLIKVKSSSRISTVKASIEAKIDNIDVATSDEIAAGYKEEVLGSFDPIMFVLSSIGLFVGTLVIGLLIYMITLEKSKEYGIIKAIGATNMHLYKIVLSQALLISIIGYFIGALVAIPLIFLIQNVVPEFLVLITFDMVFTGFFLFLAAGIIASFIPVRRLTSIDPALVFKG